MMAWVITAVVTFAATNVDDILVLVMFFSQVNASFRPRHVVIGQYLGFAILVSVSLLGFLGSLVIPRPWLGGPDQMKVYISGKEKNGRFA